MLRALALLLIVANAFVFAIGRGMIDTNGWKWWPRFGPTSIAQAPINPSAIRVQSPSTPAASVTEVLPPLPAPEEPAPAPLAQQSCWQVTGLSPAQADAIRQASAPVLRGGPDWVTTESVVASRWIVYLGKLPSQEALEDRQKALGQAQIPYRNLSGTPLAPGLALATFSTEAAARKALSELKGIPDARVVQEREEKRLITLTLDRLPAHLHQQLLGLQALSGRSLQPCP